MYPVENHDEDFHNLHASPHVITVIKSRRLRLAGHVACTGGMRNAYNYFCWKTWREGTIWKK